MLMINRIFPFLAWFKGFTLADLRVDFISGLTVALVLIPQSMAYAQLAGLPPYYGLYASFLPPMIAAMFGSSRQLATGPVAIVSLMTAATLEPLATAGSEAYVAYAIILALLVGLFQLALGVLRLGLIVNFLSHPVVNGFTNAGAIIIATSQLSKLFGVNVDNASHHYETIIHVCQAAWHYTHWPTLVMGIFAFAIMYGLKRLNPKIPNVLVAVVITTLISWAVGFENNHRASVSAIASPKAHELIEEHNATIEEIKSLILERTQLDPKVEEAKKQDRKSHGGHGGNLELLELSHQLTMLGVQIDYLKEEAQLSRTALRYMLFSAAPQPNGGLIVYLKGEMPEGLDSDGRTWRIKVGNNGLDPDNLLMTGGGAVVGVIPRGLPALSVPKLDLAIMTRLLPFAIIISLLGFVEAISIAKAMAAKTGQRLDPNQELIGQGIANIAGAIGKSYPTSGSFSRSAVNLNTGAVTGLSSVVSSMAVVIVLLFFTPFLYHLPQATLAAVIMMAVIGLINASGFIHAYKTQKYDGIISVISFVVTLALAPHLHKGIMTGVVLSLGVFLYKSMRPGVSSLALYEDQAYRDVLRHGLKECEHIAMIRFEGPLFFANASYLEDKIAERIATMPNLKHILLVSNGINDMDASGEEVLSLIVDTVRSAGYEISFSGVDEKVMDVMRRTHLYEKIGEEHMFPGRVVAIQEIYDQAHQGSSEKECPLMSVCYLDEETGQVVGMPAGLEGQPKADASN